MISGDKNTRLGLMGAMYGVAPGQSTFIVLLLLVAGLAEGIGIAAFLPLLSMNEFLGGGESDQTALGQAISSALGFLGIRPTLAGLLVVIAAVFWAKGVLVIYANTRAGYAAARYGTDLRLAMLSAITRAEWLYFTKQSAGQLANNMTSDIMRASGAYTSTFRFIALVIQVPIYLGMIFLVSWQVALISIIVGALLASTLHFLVVITRRAGLQERNSLEIITSRLVDGLNGIKPIKAMAAEDSVVPLLEAETVSLNQALRRQIMSTTALRSLSEPVLVSVMCIGLFAALAIMQMEATLLIVTAMLFYRTVNYLSQIQSNYQTFVRYESSLLEAVRKIKEAEQHREFEHGQDKPELSHAIEVKNVSYRYGENDVLRNITLIIPSGKITALKGPSGSGKTTFVDLIVGFLQPVSGQILIDNKDLAEIDVRAWRRLIGYVPQELYLFNDTVLANITLNDTDYSEEDVEQALRSAGALDFVSTLPDGLNTRVGERGSQLSGGQRQRLAIARALVRRPKLLILDEPTTALDPKTEAEVIATLRSLGPEITIFAISHQAGLVGAADVVYSSEEGRFEKLEQQIPTVVS